MKQKFDQAYRLFSKLILGDHVRQGKSTSLKNSLANVYTMDESTVTLRYSRLSGLLTFDIDRNHKSNFFRMYSMETFQLIFQCQLYYGFQEQVTQTLWAFDFLEGLIAFQFPTSIDGQEMASAVKQHSHKMSEYFKILQKRRKDQDSKRKQDTFFGKIKNMFTKDSHIEKKEQTKIISVRKQNSITFNDATGRFENIPPQFELMFAQLGITKAELDDPKIARGIMDDILGLTLQNQAYNNPCDQNLRQTVRRFYSQTQPQQLQIPSIPGIPPSLQLLLPPPQLTISPSLSANPRANLMQQIRNNTVKLKPVTTNGNKLTIDVILDKDQRDDFCKRMKQQLKRRNQALHPKVNSDSDSDS